MILRDHLAFDRTILALERTFLAYIRTAISLIAAGLTLILLYHDDAITFSSGSVLIIGGIFSAVYGTIRSIRMRKNLLAIYQNKK